MRSIFLYVGVLRAGTGAWYSLPGRNGEHSNESETELAVIHPAMSACPTWKVSSFAL